MTASDRFLIIVTGLSGSGKSIAIRQLEDDGYYCVDNLPARFLSEVLEDLSSRDKNKIAVAIDARSQTDFPTLLEQIRLLTDNAWDVRMLFLTASTPVIVQRFSETRRRHPLSLQSDTVTEITLTEAIRNERDLLHPIEPFAHVIDTTDLLPNTLRDWVKQFASATASQMTVTFESFAFKYGLPVAADLVFDVRNLPNPYYDPAMRSLTGLDEPVARYLEKQGDVVEMIADIEHFISKWLPSYQAQNRHYLTVAIGCTGGQHRSVFVAESLAKIFQTRTTVVVRHRQISQKLSY